jgi:hypothetical protein
MMDHSNHQPQQRATTVKCCRCWCNGLWNLFLILLIASVAVSAVDEDSQKSIVATDEEDDSSRSDDNVTILDLLSSELQRRPANGGFVWHKLSTNILQESSGVLRNGELTVILGPSGSGA